MNERHREMNPSCALTPVVHARGPAELDAAVDQVGIGA
jgi:hypothetical protein